MSDLPHTPGQPPGEPDSNTGSRRIWRARDLIQDYLILRGSDLVEEEAWRIVPAIHLVANLDQWLSSVFTRRLLYEMYEVTSGTPLDGLSLQAPPHRERIRHGLSEAFREKILVALTNGPPRLKPASGPGAASTQAPGVVPLLLDKTGPTRPPKPQSQTQAETGAQPSADTVVHAALQLKEVHYASNHVVERDTLGNFVAPEWVQGRGDQWPVCYTRGASVSLTAVFQVVTSPTASETVSVRGRAPLGSAMLEWTGSVQVAPGATEVRTVQLSSSATLPNEVACYEQAEITWESQPPGKPWGSAGKSQNVLYAVLGAPQGPPAYWTLLDISCRAAKGAVSEKEVVERAFVPFTTRALTRKRDNQGLTYWNPNTTKATNTRLLLSQADGSGQCGSWAELLIDMYKVHGITTGEKVMVVRTLNDLQNGSVGFLVKNWLFQGSGSLPPPFTHAIPTECIEQPGIEGQRNPNPPPQFLNHFIVRCLGQFYDPSYGAGPIGDQIKWEVGAIDGLLSGRAAGYPKSAFQTTTLLEFWSLTTQQRI